MTYADQVNETVELAKRMMKSRIEDVLAGNDDDPHSEFVQTREELDMILIRHKWLCENCKQVPVNPPGTRLRMGWSKESLEALKKAFE